MKLTPLLLALSLTSPALAYTRPPPPAATQPVRQGEYEALQAEYDAFNRCAWAKPGYQAARSANEFTEVDQAILFARAAWAQNNNGEFQKNAVIVHREIGSLTAKGWGC